MNINYVQMQSKLQNFRLNLAIFVQTCNWPCLEHEIDDLFFQIHFVQGN